MIEFLVSNDIHIKGLSPDQKRDIENGLTLVNPAWETASKMGLSLWGTPQKLKYYSYDGPDMIVPVGLLDVLQQQYPTAITTDNRYKSTKKVSIKFKGILRSYQEDAVKDLLKSTNGILCAQTGCHNKGTKVLLYSGQYKNVEDVVVGDQLMGPDSKPRNVLQLCRGRAPMFKIIPINGESFEINDEHYLTLKNTTSKITIDIQLKEYLKFAPGAKHMWKLFRTGVEFHNSTSLTIDPYFLGVLLGDGTLRGCIAVTTADPEIKKELEKQAINYNCLLRERIDIGCSTYRFVSNSVEGKNKNKLINAVCALQLFSTGCATKFVPEQYKVSTRENRLQILAGLLDTDGSYHRGYYDYISKSERLANDVVFLARSLGLRAKVISTKKYSQTGKGGTYFRVSICGNVSIVPCKVARKQAIGLIPNKNQLVTGFTVHPTKINNYYGFILDSDQRYLFEDFWVTHNSGKTHVMLKLICELQQPTLVLVHTIELANQFIDRMVSFTNISRNDIGMLGQGKKDIKPITVGLLQTVVGTDSTLLNDKFAVVIVDEVHICPAQTYAEALSKLTALYKYGASATPERADGLTKVIFWLTGPLLHNIPTEKIGDAIIKPTIRQVETTYTFPLFNSSEFQSMITNMATDVTRNQLILDTLKDYPTQQVILLCSRKDQILQLQTAIPGSVILTSDMTKKARKQVMAGLMNQTHRIIISTYSLFSTGIDVPSLEVGFFCAPIKSKVLVKQSAGRLMRPWGKDKKPIIVDFVDKRIDILKHHWYVRNKILRSL